MRKLIIGATAAVAVVSGSLVAAAAANADSGTVVRVVDGDTVIVSINNIDQTVRLLNVNTPETKDPNKPTECLGPEASDYLNEALPAGSRVRLEFDVERHDKYGRTLAGVFNASNQLVNAEIARRGLGVPMVVGENRKFLPPVEEAHSEARTAQDGLFSEAVKCTLPAQVAAASEALTAAENAAPATRQRLQVPPLQGWRQHSSQRKLPAISFPLPGIPSSRSSGRPTSQLTQPQSWLPCQPGSLERKTR